jgi:hypothetical protein
MLKKVDSANLFESAEASNLHYLILSNPKIVKVLSVLSDSDIFYEKMHFSIEGSKFNKTLNTKKFFFTEKCSIKTQNILCNVERVSFF